MNVTLSVKTSWWVDPLLRIAALVLTPVAFFMTEKQIDGLSEKFGDFIALHGVKTVVAETK